MKTPRFLLISDNTSYRIGGTRYLGPYRIAHELENIGVETYVIDRFYSLPDFFKLLEKLLDESFVGVGLSTTFFTPPEALDESHRFSTRRKRSLAYYNHGIISKDSDKRDRWFIQLKELMQEKSPHAKLFLGGTKASLFVNDPQVEMPEVDYFVMGVVDMVFPQVVRDLMEGKEPVHKLIGNKKVIDTMSHYRQPKVCPQHVWHPRWGVYCRESLPIEIGRGCAFNCKFCNYDKRENIRKPIEQLRAELIRNYELYGTQFYHFVDDCFNDHPKKVEEVCRTLIDLPFKVEWVSYVRFDVAVKYPETADLMVKAGGRGFHWGVESLTPDVARRAGKGTPPDKIKDFITAFTEKYQGLCYSTGSLIAGLPGETEQTWNEQIDWLVSTENFHFLQMGSLGISPYKHEFDGTVVDYADYSRNPQKYGFLEINNANGYWRHETMDINEASLLAESAFEKWAEKKANRLGMSTDIWIYPVLRSLGFSESEVNECYSNPDLQRQAELRDKVTPLYLKRQSSYMNFMNSLPDLKGASMAELSQSRAALGASLS